jgi:hypothetical protein
VIPSNGHRLTMTNDFDTDRALVERLLSGHEDAFAQFFDLMFPRVCRFALARVGERKTPPGPSRRQHSAK